MAGPLLETKLYVPKLRRNLVPRPRLRERMRRGNEAKLTLISAPAGFGKTTLLAEWLAEAAAAGRSVAWLSLDESDRQATSFWTYVVTALNNAMPGVGSAALQLLRSARPAVENALATVLNELSAVPTEFALVLDDYHVVDDLEVQAGMTYLLEHLPPHGHLVISTRADPALPLARLRARGELVEIRAADLRFTLDESAAYLNEVIDLDLGAADIATLEGRTEGWIAALQMAAISMQGRSDVAGFIAGFAGDDRYIVDFLVEEVLGRQPEPVRRFLVQTAILDRLSGSLCDAVTDQQDGKAMLDLLDRANMFVVALDDSRRWYRYHHLFADMLRAHLLNDSEHDAAELHRRASEWFAQNGEPAQAVRHALAAGDSERAAALVELAIPELRRNRQEAVLHGWLTAIPHGVVRVRPVLAVGFIGALMASGKFDGIDELLRDAEQLLAGPPEAMIVLDQEEVARLAGTIETFWAALALGRGDAPATIEHARLALERATDGDDLTRGAASALSGLALWSTGDLNAAHRAYSICVKALTRAGHISDVLGCTITLADIRLTQGRLGEALRTYEQALRLAAEAGGSVLRGTPDMYVGMSQIAYERDDLSAANELLARAQELGEHLGLPQNPYRWRVAMARVRGAEGDHASALALLTEAERVYDGDFSPNVRPVPAVRARALLADGRLGEAVSWAREQQLSADDELSYVREFEHITLARVLLARALAERDESLRHDAARLLRRLHDAAEAGGRTRNLIEILILQALTEHARGELARALGALDAALTLAEPEGYLRVFTDEGPAMASLLSAIAKRQPRRGYVRRLASGGVSATKLTSALVDPLSERELDVLRLLKTDLDGPDIARQLTVSVNTIRTHTKNIYAKLGVNSRRAAVRRAAELDLLASPHRPITTSARQPNRPLT